METYQGETLRAFSFGGLLRATVEMGDLFCELTTNAPIFMLQNEPVSVSEVIASEIMDFLAQDAVKLVGHEDELYKRLSNFEPYQLFLSCLVSLKKRVEAVPMAQRREGYHKLVSNLNRAIQIVHDADGWDGNSPSLEDLLSANNV